MRKIFVLACLLFCTYSNSFAQNQKKTLLGSFVLDQQVFQYQYKRDGNIHTLKLSTLAKPSTVLDDSKYLKTKKFLDDLTNDDSIAKFFPKATQGKKDTLTLLSKYLEELKNVSDKRAIWNKHLENINTLIEFFDRYKIEDLTIGDTTAKDIYSVSELLSTYRSFLQNASEPQASEEIPFPELKLEEFEIIFLQELTQLYQAKKKDLPDFLQTRARSKAMDIMFEIKARADFQEDQPVTAFMILKRKYIDINFEVPIAISKNPIAEIIPKNTKETTPKDSLAKVNSEVNLKAKKNKTKKIILNQIDTKSFSKDSTAIVKVRFQVINIIVEFEDGGIKNIFADLQPNVKEYQDKYGSHSIRFRNDKPISIIGKFDPDFFSRNLIFAGNTRELMNTLFELAKEQNPSKSFDKELFLNSKSYNGAYFILSNLLDYKVVSETDNEDYSPSNSKIELSEPHAIVELKKEKRSKILSARAYTDFQGLSDDQPNGLVQIEVSKRVNLLSGRRQGFLKFANGNRRGIYSGGLTYIEPRFTLSKIEENNRYLMVDSFSMDKTKSLTDSTNHFLVNPLEVLKYQQWSFGLDVNIMKFSLHNRKSNFQINASFTFGRTTVADSLKISQNQITQLASKNLSRVSTTTYGIGIMYEVKPDSRYGFSFGYDFRWMDVLNTRFEYNKMFSNQFHTAWFNGFFKINDDSKMFWRFRKNWLSKNFRYNYYQIQLGYELDIFKAAK